jgi:nucleoside-diphosphate-sugar epimerase
MHTILGSGGAIGIDLAKELTKYTNKIRLVSRNPKRINDSDELYTADFSDPTQLDKAIEGSEVVYLIAGFKYDLKVWRKTWPALMSAVIKACEKYNCKLVFFDNIYMYDKNQLGNITEETPINPPSKKGAVRAQLHKMIFDEVNAGRLKAIIARAPDIYGPFGNSSVLIETVYKNLIKGKAAYWMADAGKLHTFGFTPDLAKATATLGNTADAYNQVWHLPTDINGLTGKQWVELIAKELKVAPKCTTLPSWIVGAMGLFMPLMKELHEMLYQYDRDYIFNSSKFEKRFNFTPVKNEEGIRKTIEILKKQIS